MQQQKHWLEQNAEGLPSGMWRDFRGYVTAIPSMSYVHLSRIEKMFRREAVNAQELLTLPVYDDVTEELSARRKGFKEQFVKATKQTT